MVIRFLSGTPALNLCLCSAFRLSYTETCVDKNTISVGRLDNKTTLVLFENFRLHSTYKQMLKKLWFIPI